MDKLQLIEDVRDIRRASENVSIKKEIMGLQGLEMKKHTSDKGITDVMGATPSGISSDKTKTQFEPPMIGMGNLIENVNKRSEASNRKYRAFIHFLKNEKKGLTVKKDIEKITL